MQPLPTREEPPCAELFCTPPETSALNDPTIVEPTDAIFRLCVRLWPVACRGTSEVTAPTPIGHEYCGIVEEIGSEVTSVRRGQCVIGSFIASDDTCAHCRAGYQSACAHRHGVTGAQA